MKNLTRTALLFFTLSFIACEPLGTITPNNFTQDDRLITETKALSIAENFLLENITDGNRSARGRKPKFKIHPLKGNHGKNAVYIANNEEGGWQIIAGSKVKQPILAYGLKNSFNTDTTLLNPGLKWWMRNTILNMEMAYRAPYDDEGDPPPGDDPDCDNISTSVAPIMVDINGTDVEFNQGFPENRRYKSCSETDEFDNAPAGCVPIAMAQIMWHYQSPSRYDWVNIPREPVFVTGSSTTEIETGNFIWDIKEALEPWISVNCYGTGTLTDTYNNLDKSFDEFGYDTYKFTSSATLKQELNWGRPVIAVGGSGIEGDRHAWVIDGYNSYYTCNTGSSTLYLHCNWGWGGTSNDFYGIGGFSPPGSDFNSNLKFHKVINR